jgi:diaminopimelate decarboxylase
MTHFAYRHGQLHAEAVALSAIASSVGTPFYCYSSMAIQQHYKAFADALAGLDATICYAVKANPNLAVIRTLALLGAGADVVSEGELRRAIAAGVPPGRIVFSGVGKTNAELETAVDLGLMQINVESEIELERLNRIATSRSRRIRVGIRVNPDVDANTHAKITTGRLENKFGIEWTQAHRVARKAAGMAGIAGLALAVHIGSQLTDLQPFEDAFLRVRDLVLMLRADGIPIDRLDLGGGLGIPYESETPPSPAAYADVIRANLGDLGCSFIVEPGRALVGSAGVLVSRIVLVKEGATRTFIICDAGMNDLIRPALYDAYHKILPVAEPDSDSERTLVDIVGPVCETGDTFARQIPLPPLAAEDLIAFATAGAYGAAMSSDYNSRPLVPEVLVRGDRFALVRRRPTIDEMLARDSMPEWLPPGDGGG